jgi:tight adherence protein B
MRAMAVVLAALAGACLPRPTGALRLQRRTPTRSADWPQQRRTFRPPFRAGSGATSAATRRRTVIELTAALSAELRAGAPPRAALAAAADSTGLRDIARVAEVPHGDVGLALGAAGDLPGGAGLRRLLACWQVCERSGGALAPATGRLAESLREEEQIRRQVAAELAAPRATAVLLAGLPAVGLMMGAALGANPAAILLDTGVGHLCLFVGLSLEVLGLLWTRHITRSPLPP